MSTELLTVAEAAAAIGRRERVVAGWVSTGRVPGVEVQDGRPMIPRWAIRPLTAEGRERWRDEPTPPLLGRRALLDAIARRVGAAVRQGAPSDAMLRAVLAGALDVGMYKEIAIRTVDHAQDGRAA